MTTTIGNYTGELVGLLSDSRAFADVLVIVTLTALLLQREMLRQRPHTWARAGATGLTAIAVPLVIAWVAITIQGFAALLS
jgi:hypothetical protein